MTHTIPHYIKSNAKNYPKDIALREKKFGVWKTKDWQQCLEEIENITLGLHAKGIIGKKTIAILGNNTPRWTLAEIAVQSLGSIPLGIYSDALESEIIYLIDYSSCRVVFVEDEEQADKIMSLSDSKGKIDLIVYDEPKGMNKYDDKRLISYKNLLKTGHEFKKHNTNFFNKLLENINEEDTCIFCPTSGTTANPKLAMISHKALLNHAKSYLSADPKNSTDEYVSVLPMPWIMEQT